MRSGALDRLRRRFASLMEQGKCAESAMIEKMPIYRCSV
jgi:hypothetical protein